MRARTGPAVVLIILALGLLAGVSAVLLLQRPESQNFRDMARATEIMDQADGRTQGWVSADETALDPVMESLAARYERMQTQEKGRYHLLRAHYRVNGSKKDLPGGVSDYLLALDWEPATAKHPWLKSDLQKLRTAAPARLDELERRLHY